MRKLKRSTVLKIHLNGEIDQTINTPKGTMTIWKLEESRGYKTAFMVKTFKYVELPHNAGFFTLRPAFLEMWKQKGWI